jgi:hypothetical protein
LTAPREEDDVRSEMESEVKFFGYRGERRTLGTCFNPLSVSGNIKDGAHHRPTATRRRYAVRRLEESGSSSKSQGKKFRESVRSSEPKESTRGWSEWWRQESFGAR